jgi:hypothetical protein
MEKTGKKKIGSDSENSNDYFYDNIELKNIGSNNKMILSTTLSTETSNPFKTITNNFFKHKPKVNVKLIKNFHKDYLREKFLNNKKYKKTNPQEKAKYKLISPYLIKNPKSSKRNIPIRLNLNCNSNNTSINNSLSKTKINLTYNKIYLRDNSINNINNRTLTRRDTFEKYDELLENKKVNNNIYSYLPKIRAENLGEFKDKIKLEIKGKYLLSFRQELNNNYKLDLQSKIENYDKNIVNVKYNKNLFDSYCETYDNYEKKLFSDLLIEFETNELLKVKIANLKSDIQRLKYHILRTINLLNENFKIKCYLMSVKNQTKLIEKFPKEDLEELKNDQKIITYYMSQISKKKRIQVRYSRKMSNLIPKRNFKRNDTIFTFLNDSKSNLERKSISKNSENQLIHENKLMFKDKNDFQQHFDNIVYNIMFSLNNYTEISHNLNYEKTKLDKLIEEEKIFISKKNEINENIEMLENQFNFKKIQNEEIINYYNQLKSSHNDKKNTLSKLHKKICNIFNNIEKYLKIDSTTKSELDDFKMLQLLEVFFYKLIQQNINDKKNYSNLYDKILKKYEIKKKLEKNKGSLKNQNDSLIKRMNKIFEKSQKLIIKPRKKIGENLYLMFENLKKKPKINKTEEHSDFDLIEY